MNIFKNEMLSIDLISLLSLNESHFFFYTMNILNFLYPLNITKNNNPFILSVSSLHNSLMLF